MFAHNNVTIKLPLAGEEEGERNECHVWRVVIKLTEETVLPVNLVFIKVTY